MAKLTRASDFRLDSNWKSISDIRSMTNPQLALWEAMQIRHFLTSLPDFEGLDRARTPFDIRHALTAVHTMLADPDEEHKPRFLTEWETELNITLSKRQRKKAIHFALKASIATPVQELNYKVTSRLPALLHK